MMLSRFATLRSDWRASSVMQIFQHFKTSTYDYSKSRRLLGISPNTGEAPHNQKVHKKHLLEGVYKDCGNDSND
jgi:hypothetical protein